MTGLAYSMDQSRNILEGLEHHRAGRLAEAEKIYRRILDLQPDHPDALHLLGVLAGAMGQPELAADLIRRAIAIQPGEAVYHGNLGNILREVGRLDAAIEQYLKAAGLAPDQPELLNNLGNALREAHRTGEAIVVMRRAVAVKADMPEGHYNLAMALADSGQLDDAIESFQQAIALRPDYAEAYGNVGNCYKDVGLIDEAVQSFRKAGELKKELGEAHRNLLYTIHFHPDYDEKMILAEHQEWGRRQIAPVAENHRNRDPERRLRIGYVSPDLRDHVVGRNIVPLLREHDHANYQVICYANHLTDDRWTHRMRGWADQWRPVAGASDDQLAALIRTDGVDILVDLAMQMTRNRLMVFAYKPAPVQVTFGAYPGGTGLSTMDYRLTDTYLDPPGADQFYVEKSVRLPHSFWCYDVEGMSLEYSPAVGPLPALSQGHITFGCLNNACKINGWAIELWRNVLDAVPGSRLVLLSLADSHRRRIVEQLGERVDFVDRRERAKYLEWYARIDVGLDTFPYNGHTTSLDSLWMGVPVVTLVGKTAVGRAGWSQLSNLGLTELAANTTEDYVKVASLLAADLDRLASLRAGLRQRMSRSPLMDAKRFARDIEAAYRWMWRQWIAR